jgi:hypothetical protein
MVFRAGVSFNILGATWKIAGASVIGLAHERLGGRCEDSWASRQQPVDGGSCFSICVSDGAGSAPKGWVGANAVCKLVCTWLLDDFECVYFGDHELYVSSFRKLVRKPIEKMAAHGTAALKQYACTVVSAAVCSDGRWVIAHIGDGGIVGRFEHGIEILSYPTKGEYANETYFITDHALQDVLKVLKGDSESKRGALTGLALFSDGLEGSLISKRDGKVAPAITHMFEWLDKNDLGSVSLAIRNSLHEVFRLKSNDDCTLAIGVKRE